MTAPDIGPYRFTTRNLRESENAAHSREGARARGFEGSIVGGAIVYGQMIRPLIDRFGETWLERSSIDLRFKAPAYDDDSIETVFEPCTQPGCDATGKSWKVRALGRGGAELIAMTAELPTAGADLPAADARAAMEPIDWEGERVEGTYDRMEIDRPFRTFRFTISAEEQADYCRGTGDATPFYLHGRNPPAHPGLVMAQGSRVVANQFVMPFWIHAGSVLQHRRVIRVGEDVELRCVPIEKWQRGGSDWVRFYQVYRVDDTPAVEVWKTSVIKVAQRAASTSS